MFKYFNSSQKIEKIIVSKKFIPIEFYGVINICYLLQYLVNINKILTYC